MDDPQTPPEVPPDAGAGPDPPASDESHEASATDSPPRPRGPWATIGWTALGLVIMFAVQNVVAFAYVLARLAMGQRVKPEEIATDGNLLALATLATTPVVVGYILLLVRRRGRRVADALNLTVPSRRQALVALAGLAALMVASDLLSYLLGRPIVPPVMVAAYRTSWPPLLLLAMLVAGPVEEEVLIRGFLFRGIADSRWGPGVAVFVSSAIWALLHVQYDLYGIATILVMGLYVGEVRRRTGSLPMTILLHGFANLFATVELILQTGRSP